MLVPTRGKILVEIISDIKRTESGLWIAQTARDIPHCGRVVAVGAPAIDRKGQQVKPCATQGDIVHFKKQWLTFWEDQGKKYVFLNNEDVVGKEE